MVLRKGEKSDNYFLKGYVLFVYEPIACTIQGKILCSHKNYRGLGRELLDNVKQFALNNKVVKWRIFSLPYQRLRNYYESYGFKYLDTIYRDGKAKVYKMSYTLKYGPIVNAIPIENKDITIKVNGVHIISSSNYNYMLGIVTILKNELAYSDTIYFKYENDYSESLFVENKLKLFLC